MGFVKEFKEFAMKGNVMDMAVGVIIGGAFGKIVTSLVDDVLMPIIGMLTGGVDFNGLVAKVGDATVKYGTFIHRPVYLLHDQGHEQAEEAGRARSRGSRRSYHRRAAG